LIKYKLVIAGRLHFISNTLALIFKVYSAWKLNLKSKVKNRECICIDFYFFLQGHLW
jgi:hypothetical protein